MTLNIFCSHSCVTKCFTLLFLSEHSVKMIYKGCTVSVLKMFHEIHLYAQSSISSEWLLTSGSLGSVLFLFLSFLVRLNGLYAIKMDLAWLPYLARSLISPYELLKKNRKENWGRPNAVFLLIARKFTEDVLIVWANLTGK